MACFRSKKVHLETPIPNPQKRYPQPISAPVSLDFQTPDKMMSQNLLHIGNIAQGDYYEKEWPKPTGTAATETIERAMRERREQRDGAMMLCHVPYRVIPLQRDDHIAYACSTCGEMVAVLALETLRVYGYDPLKD